jgi:hypothetical protein
MRIRSRTWALIVTAATLGACTSPQSVARARAGTDGSLDINSTQNGQTWTRDGAVSQFTDQAPDSGQIDSGRIDYMGTSVSTLLNLGTEGLGVRNAGNLGAGSIDITFGEPIVIPGDAGASRVVVPITSVSIAELTNDVTAIVAGQNAQAEALIGALGTVAPEQAAAVLRALERDEAITRETAGAVREALGIVGALIP